MSDELSVTDDDDMIRFVLSAARTWAVRFLQHLLFPEDLWRAVASLLRGTHMEQDYALVYFMPHLASCFATPPIYIVGAVNAGLKDGDERFKDLVDSWGSDIDSNLDLKEKPAGDPWRQPFLDARHTFVPKVEDDDIPF